MRSPTPRRQIIAAFIGFALFTAACGGSSEAPTVAEPPTTEAPTPAEPAATEPPATDPPVTAPPSTEAPTTEAPTTDPPITEPPVDELELGSGRGDYQVGVQTITISDQTGRDRPLTVDVWFPLAPDSTDAATSTGNHQYTLLPGVYYESPHAISSDPTAISPDGPFPLVIYSHGSGGLRYIHSDYTEAIASHGYIVAAADHTGNTAADDLLGTRADSSTIALTRPQDVTALIDAMLDPESTETVGYVGAIDPERIAVTGHSFGGFTAYAVASGYDNDLGEYVADERVGAIIALAPAASETLLSDERLASIDIPALVMAGTDDQSTPIEPNVTRPWELSASSPSYRVDLIAAEHLTFSDYCAYQIFMPSLADVPQSIIDLVDSYALNGCSPGDMPIARAQSITNTFATTFLDEVFRDGDPILAEQVDEQGDLVYFIK